MGPEPEFHGCHSVLNQLERVLLLQRPSAMRNTEYW